MKADADETRAVNRDKRLEGQHKREELPLSKSLRRWKTGPTVTFDRHRAAASASAKLGSAELTA